MQYLSAILLVLELLCSEAVVRIMNYKIQGYFLSLKENNELGKVLQEKKGMFCYKSDEIVLTSVMRITICFTRRRCSDMCFTLGRIGTIIREISARNICLEVRHYIS